MDFFSVKLANCNIQTIDRTWHGGGEVTGATIVGGRSCSRNFPPRSGKGWREGVAL